MFRTLLKCSKCLNTGDGLVRAICESNFVQARNIKIAKKLVTMWEMKIYLHSPTILYIPAHVSTASWKILRIKAENSRRRLTAVERESSAQKFPALPSCRVSLKLRARARVYFARLTISIAKVGDYSQSKVRAGLYKTRLVLTSG